MGPVCASHLRKSDDDTLRPSHCSELRAQDAKRTFRRKCRDRTSPPLKHAAQNSGTWWIYYQSRSSRAIVSLAGRSRFRSGPCYLCPYRITMRAGSAYPKLTNRSYVKYVAIAVLGVLVVFLFLSDSDKNISEARGVSVSNVRGS